MLPELGFIALLLATTASLLLSTLPFIGLRTNNLSLVSRSWNLSVLVSIFVSIAMGLLAYAFVKDDFSVEYVALHSNSQLPLFFKIAATWGGHEGSMLFWLFALSLWLMCFAWRSRHIDLRLAARSLGILGMICLGFCLFILFFSNPFGRIFPPAVEGRDLNPMLQDIGLIIHPPLLYLGYVGFAVNFALTAAGLVQGNLDAALARWIRPWVLTAWLLLTLGILVGAWWAYYELGWGGWWFWDPVENASLMPWLIGLGLLHALIVTEKRGIFQYWSILLSLLAFAFSLLGTFIVRSGVLTSVHAFAIDSTRGSALLALFFLLTVGGLLLFALRVRVPERQLSFSLFSKESAILLINILTAIATLTVFLGTFYPMLFSAFNWGSISVGAPYFNSIFLPLVLIALLAMLVVFSLPWKDSQTPPINKLSILFIKHGLFALLGMISSGLLIFYHLQQDSLLTFNLIAWLLISLASWLLLLCLWQLVRIRTLNRLGMVLAHGGLAVVIIGATMSSYFGSEIGVRLAPEQHQHLANLDFHYLGFSNEIGPNYTAEKAHFMIEKNHQIYAHVYPERRYYDVRTMNMSEVGIDWGWLGDVYVVMGDPLGKGEFTFRLHYKPFIRWLWLGAVLMALGACCALFGLRQK